MDFDLSVVPFSRYGSYIAFSHLSAAGGRSDGLYLRSVRGPGLSPQPLQEVFRLGLLREGQLMMGKETASPTLLRVETDDGYAEICLPEPRLVRIRCVGTSLRLAMRTSAYDNAIPRKGNRWQVTKSGAFEIKYMLTSLQGRLAADAPWDVLKSKSVIIDLVPDADTGRGELAIEEFDTVWQEREYSESFDACLERLQQEYLAWRTKIPEVPEAYADAADLAAYITWSCVVAPEGYLTRPAMYMSKNWMTSIWSWDNCFNAMALAYKNPELAWDQFMIMIDNQNASGVFPDLMNDRLVSWSFNKPPVQGWALKRMMDQTDLINKKRLQEVYEPLGRWTQWWFDYRDDDGDGIPQYNHGNDSGWDNSTVFAVRPPIESPDLSAYLIIQMDVLADVARILGKEREAREWKAQADDLLQKMLAHFWQGNRFVAMRPGDHETIESDSLLLFMPIILGKRLPEDVVSKLIAGLKAEDRFLTEFGLASESTSSPLYQSDGYWRGAVWGAPTMIITDGLAALGETEFARELRHQFCDTAARSGMAENFDSTTGVALHDPAFTWTSSIFLILAHELLGSEES